MKHFAGPLTFPIRHRLAHKDQAGVALIEALVSTVIFSFGLLGLIGLAARAVSFSVGAEDRTRAAVLANDVASAMWTRYTVNIDAATLSAWQTAVANPAQGGLHSGTLTITPLGTSNSADIVITWQPTSSTTPDTLRTRVTLP
jgi:type IV pilus assembly protein PilV